jgi:hypothetical protein
MIWKASYFAGLKTFFNCERSSAATVLHSWTTTLFDRRSHLLATLIAAITTIAAFAKSFTPYYLVGSTAIFAVVILRSQQKSRAADSVRFRRVDSARFRLFFQYALRAKVEPDPPNLISRTIVEIQQRPSGLRLAISMYFLYCVRMEFSGTLAFAYDFRFFLGMAIGDCRPETKGSRAAEFDVRDCPSRH